MKKCFKCGKLKQLSDFYKHKGMKDGHVNKCKECNKNDVAEHRLLNLNKIRKYDRERGNRQRKTYTQEYRKKYPNKYRAHTLVSNNKRRGNLHEQPCEICGSTEKIVAHHDDYAKPLNVRWMCQACHKQWHVIYGEGKNA
jgi:hypothetical protein